MFRNPILLLITILIGLVLVVLLGIGAFPPSVAPQPVERTIPAERFGPRG